jgi:transcription elongation GreA/GreB family factor
MIDPIEAFNPTAESAEQSNRTQLLKSVLSELQLAANRLNAQKSTGPAKPETKDRVKYNARRHGFTGQVLLLTLEEQPLYDSFVSGTLEDLAPKGTQETFLAHSIAEESWRLNQIRAYCSNLTAAGTFEGAGKQFHAGEGWNHQIEDAVVDTVVVRDHSKELALMSLYMQRTQRAREKYKKELQELQAGRKARREAELEEARLLFQLAETEGVEYDPAADGIVFSREEIKRYTERYNRLNCAKNSERNHRSMQSPPQPMPQTRRAA